MGIVSNCSIQGPKQTPFVLAPHGLSGQQYLSVTSCI